MACVKVIESYRGSVLEGGDQGGRLILDEVTLQLVQRLEWGRAANINIVLGKIIPSGRE